MTDKNMADVADKAVDKLSGGIEAVARAVEKVAPHVWEVLVRQATYEGAVYLASNLLALVVIAIAVRKVLPRLDGWRLKLARAEKAEYPSLNRDKDPADMVPMGFQFGVGLAALVTFSVVVGCFVGATQAALKLANPEYYAAKDIIGAAK